MTAAQVGKTWSPLSIDNKGFRRTNHYFAALFEDGALTFPSTQEPACSEQTYVCQRAELLIRNLNLDSFGMLPAASIPEIQQFICEPLFSCLGKQTGMTFRVGFQIINKHTKRVLVKLGVAISQLSNACVSPNGQLNIGNCFCRTEAQRRVSQQSSQPEDIPGN